MSDYTPTTQKVEDRYWLATVDDEGVRLRAGEESARAEFRAWLAEHDAKVRAEGFSEGVDFIDNYESDTWGGSVVAGRHEASRRRREAGLK